MNTKKILLISVIIQFIRRVWISHLCPILRILGKLICRSITQPMLSDYPYETPGSYFLSCNDKDSENFTLFITSDGNLRLIFERKSWIDCRIAFFIPLKENYNVLRLFMFFWNVLEERSTRELRFISLAHFVLDKNLATLLKHVCLTDLCCTRLSRWYPASKF